VTAGTGDPVRGATGGPGWRLGPIPVWVAAAGALLLALALLTGRPDVALLGATAVVTASAAHRRVRGAVGAHVVHGGDDGTDAPGLLQGRVHLSPPADADAVRLRVERPGHRPAEVVVAAGADRVVPVAARSVRTGRQRLFDVQTQGLAGDGHLTGPVTRVPAEDVVVLPRGRDVGDLPLPPRLRGATGRHRSRRPGEGGDLRDVHPRAPGDPVRRIDWRVTARRSPALEQLYVRRSFALAEATVTLVVDSRDDLGPDPATWSGHRPVRPEESTSLDLARHAAASVGEGHVVLGDRVGLEDLGVRRRTLRVGTGRRQLDRLVHQLALLRPEGRPAARVRPPQLTPGGLVYLFSTFLDDEPVVLARTWQGTGHRVVAVDVLPEPRPARDHRLQLALRMVLIDRDDRLAEVRAAGITIVRWADPGAGVALHTLARTTQRQGQRGGGARGRSA
jgi:uncharacterized protein (DUF58 family)